MNLYVGIVLLGLAAKLWITYYALNRGVVDHCRPHLNLIRLTAVVLISYSLPQIPLVAEGWLATPFGLERHYVIRWYFLHGGFCTFLSIGAVLVFLNSSFSRTRWFYPFVLFLNIGWLLYGTHVTFFTETLVQSEHVLPRPLQIELGKAQGIEYVKVWRLVVSVFLFAGLIFFARRYQSATSNRTQIASLYAVIAFTIFCANVVAGLFFAHPIIHAIKGVFFTIGLMLVCSDRKVFDARPAAMVTLEAKANRDLQRIFVAYANEEIGHKDAIRKIEKEMVRYKLRKVSGFKEAPGSALPQVANSMQLGLSTLYEMMNRLGLDRPKKKRSKS